MTPPIQVREYILDTYIYIDIYIYMYIRRHYSKYVSTGETKYEAAGNISQFQNIIVSDEKTKYNHYYRGVALCGRQSL